MMKGESHQTIAMVRRPSLIGAIGTGLLTCADSLIVTWNSGRQGDATLSLATSSPYGDV